MRKRILIATVLLIACNSVAQLSLTNAPGPTSITSTSAVMRATIVTNAHTNAQVAFYWGTFDATTNVATWSSTSAVINSTGGVVSFTNTALSPNVRYYYRMHGTNTNTSTWAAPTTNFYTIASAPTSTPVAETFAVMVDINDLVVYPADFFADNGVTTTGAVDGLDGRITTNSGLIATNTAAIANIETDYLARDGSVTPSAGFDWAEQGISNGGIFEASQFAGTGVADTNVVIFGRNSATRWAGGGVNDGCLAFVGTETNLVPPGSVWLQTRTYSTNAVYISDGIGAYYIFHLGDSAFRNYFECWGHNIPGTSQRFDLGDPNRPWRRGYIDHVIGLTGTFNRVVSPEYVAGTSIGATGTDGNGNVIQGGIVTTIGSVSTTNVLNSLVVASGTPGAELTTNGTFTGSTDGWALSGASYVQSGTYSNTILILAGASGTLTPSNNISQGTGSTYQAQFDLVINNEAVTNSVIFGGLTSSFVTAESATMVVKVGTINESNFVLTVIAGTGFPVYVDNVSVKQLTGGTIHAGGTIYAAEILVNGQSITVPDGVTPWTNNGLWYVAIDGSDDNDGRSIRTPKATVTNAIAGALSAGAATNVQVVLVGPGEYCMDAGIVFTNAFVHLQGYSSVDTPRLIFNSGVAITFAGGGGWLSDIHVQGEIAAGGMLIPDTAAADDTYYFRNVRIEIADYTNGTEKGINVRGGKVEMQNVEIEVEIAFEGIPRASGSVIWLTNNASLHMYSVEAYSESSTTNTDLSVIADWSTGQVVIINSHFALDVPNADYIGQHFAYRNIGVGTDKTIMGSRFEITGASTSSLTEAAVFSVEGGGAIRSANNVVIVSGYNGHNHFAYITNGSTLYSHFDDIQAEAGVALLDSSCTYDQANSPADGLFDVDFITLGGETRGAWPAFERNVAGTSISYLDIGSPSFLTAAIGYNNIAAIDGSVTDMTDLDGFNTKVDAVLTEWVSVDENGMIDSAVGWESNTFVDSHLTPANAECSLLYTNLEIGTEYVYKFYSSRDSSAGHSPPRSLQVGMYDVTNAIQYVTNLTATTAFTNTPANGTNWLLFTCSSDNANKGAPLNGVEMTFSAQASAIQPDGSVAYTGYQSYDGYGFTNVGAGYATNIQIMGSILDENGNYGSAGQAWLTSGDGESNYWGTVAAGGGAGSQTPYTNTHDAAGFDITNLNAIVHTSVNGVTTWEWGYRATHPTQLTNQIHYYQMTVGDTDWGFDTWWVSSPAIVTNKSRGN